MLGGGVDTEQVVALATHQVEPTARIAGTAAEAWWRFSHAAGSCTHEPSSGTLGP